MEMFKHMCEMKKMLFRKSRLQEWIQPFLRGSAIECSHSCKEQCGIPLPKLTEGVRRRHYAPGSTAGEPKPEKFGKTC